MKNIGRTVVIQVGRISIVVMVNSAAAIAVKDNPYQCAFPKGAVPNLKQVKAH